MNSAPFRKDFTDHSLVGTTSSYSSMWSTSSKRSMSTTYIDGGMIQSQYGRPYSIRDSFPKGKSRPKLFNLPEKKLVIVSTTKKTDFKSYFAFYI